MAQQEDAQGEPKIQVKISAAVAVDGLPTDTMLWSLLQSISGGSCVYDLESIKQELGLM